jgi:hypothetical protein
MSHFSRRKYRPELPLTEQVLPHESAHQLALLTVDQVLAAYQGVIPIVSFGHVLPSNNLVHPTASLTLDRGSIKARWLLFGILVVFAVLMVKREVYIDYPLTFWS